MKISVLMLGPARNVRGGISSVVNQYFVSSLSGTIDLTYIATQVDGGRPRKFIQVIVAFLQFAWHMATSRCEIVHIHMASRASFSRKSIFLDLSKRLRKRVVLHVHGAEFKQFYETESGPSKQRRIRSALQKADIVLALSESWRQTLRDIAGAQADIRVLPNPVRVPEIAARPVNTQNLNILFMGRLGERKGVYDLLEASRELLVEFENVRFILCGDGEVEAVRARVQGLGLSERIEVPGWETNRDRRLADASIFVLPSYNEGLPMAVLEAASYGLPIVSTPVGGIAEVVADGESGILVAPGDRAALRDALKRLVQSRDLRERMGGHARKTVIDKFEVSAITRKLEAVYEELMRR
jgi:glycosyltransferase involved in cell wall biosynthesis